MITMQYSCYCCCYYMCLEVKTQKYHGIFEVQSPDKHDKIEKNLLWLHNGEQNPTRRQYNLAWNSTWNSTWRTNPNPKWDRTRCPERVSVLCQHAAPVAFVPWKPPEFGEKVKSGDKVKFGKEWGHGLVIGIINKQGSNSTPDIENIVQHSREGHLGNGEFRTEFVLEISAERWDCNYKNCFFHFFMCWWITNYV